MREVILDDGGSSSFCFYFPLCVMEQRQRPGPLHHQHHQLCHPAQLVHLWSCQGYFTIFKVDLLGLHFKVPSTTFTYRCGQVAQCQVDRLHALVL